MAIELIADGVECSKCEGFGAIPVGEFGSHYRDGQTYDSPGMVVCEDCCGAGRLAAGGLTEDEARDIAERQDDAREAAEERDWRTEGGAR